ncbi:hypothetical protein CIB95_01685 [Lottiidibacillus patelloidae]|uniref:Flavoprotein domain-containing protein n=1 Tax=Lottiidibacillus patelloidae TaxID=2670334 RepID=A0A263BXJ9_9BACI|nr:hypothetical protein [Lottiidibacillus patelloidae]OZM58308.1 hypothetical protein CIB95_01685 [Lottiidibacillus patelloidae]
MKNKIEAIVREVVLNYFKEKNGQHKKLLILLNYETPNQNEVWDLVGTLSKTYDVTLCVSEKWTTVPNTINVAEVIAIDGLTDQTMTEMASNVDALFLPTISYGFLAKLAMTIDDEKALALCIHFQLVGKKLIVAKDAIARKGEQKLLMPHSIQERISTYISQLVKDGVSVLKMKEVEKWLQQNVDAIQVKKPVLLAKHIVEIAEEGDNELQLSKNTVISPLGKDMARELGISLKMKE